MVHHPVSCSQNSRYLHSGGSNCIDFAEGVGLFFLCSSMKVLLNHQRPVANDSPLPAGPMTRFVHRRTVRSDLTSEHSELPQLLYTEHNMPARQLPVCQLETEGLMWSLTLIEIHLFPATQICEC